MYLKRLFIRNYRSIKELDINFLPGKNVIIGRNNSGKSNIIKAVDVVLSQNSPTYVRTENVTENDFYSWKEDDGGQTVTKQAQEMDIWCELERGEGEHLNYDDIYKCFGFYVYGNYSSRSPVRIPRASLPHNFDPIFDVDEDAAPRYYVNPKKPALKQVESEFENKFQFAYAFKATLDDDGNIYKDIRLLYRESDNADWVLSFRATVRNEFLQSAIIPSFRDPTSQLRPVAWSWYGKLMRYLTDQHARSASLQAAFEKVKDEGEAIFADVTEKVKQTCIDIAFPGTELHFQFVADKKTDLFKNCQIYIDDGFRSQLTEKGSGIQSAAVIGLFNYYTKYVNTLSSALLCVEEPEIYLHPHGRRVISDRLDDFLDGGRNQVILTTHSEDFIRSGLADLNVILVSKTEGKTDAKPINLKNFRRLLINAKQNEIFFAEKVIVCEGLDEYVVRSVANELFPGQLDEKNISVVSVDGKDNISSMVKLVLRLGTQCFVCADFDYFLRDKDAEAKKKYGEEQKLHSSICTLGSQFFSQACTFGTQGNQALAMLQSERATIKANQEEAFYCAKTSTEITCVNDLPVLLSELRAHGVYILPGEIEDLVKDHAFLTTGEKLTGEKIYEMSALIANGKKPSDLFDVSGFQEFLSHVLA